MAAAAGSQRHVTAMLAGCVNASAAHRQHCFHVTARPHKGPSPVGFPTVPRPLGHGPHGGPAPQRERGGAGAEHVWGWGCGLPPWQDTFGSRILPVPVRRRHGPRRRRRHAGRGHAPGGEHRPAPPHGALAAGCHLPGCRRRRRARRRGPHAGGDRPRRWRADWRCVLARPARSGGRVLSPRFAGPVSTRP